MANGESTTLQLTPGGIMVTERKVIEPILPMGHLVKKLGCEVTWKEDGLSIQHPLRGLCQYKIKMVVPNCHGH